MGRGMRRRIGRGSERGFRGGLRDGLSNRHSHRLSNRHSHRLSNRLNNRLNALLNALLTSLPILIKITLVTSNILLADAHLGADQLDVIVATLYVGVVAAKHEVDETKGERATVTMHAVDVYRTLPPENLLRALDEDLRGGQAGVEAADVAVTETHRNETQAHTASHGGNPVSAAPRRGPPPPRTRSGTGGGRRGSDPATRREPLDRSETPPDRGSPA